MATHKTQVLDHYKAAFQALRVSTFAPPVSTYATFESEFLVWEFAPSSASPNWKYATFGMSGGAGINESRIELHLISPTQYQGHVELLSAVAHYHITVARLDEGHTVNFGRPWFPSSLCEYGLISKPYVYGPALEYSQKRSLRHLRFLWLVPITKAEREYISKYGLDRLEEQFEKRKLEYWRPDRVSCVGARLG